VIMHIKKREEEKGRCSKVEVVEYG
jgi:hypothetical protein